MANLALVTANSVRVVESNKQFDGVADEDISPGAPVRVATNGNITNANGTTGTEGAVAGMALGKKLIKAGCAVTVLQDGVVDGFNVTQAFAAPIYVSDTDGRIGDTAGTVTVQIGRVISAYAQPLGVTPDKLISIHVA